MAVINAQGLPVQLILQPDQNFANLASTLAPGVSLRGRVTEVLADGKAIVNFRGVNVMAALQNVSMARGEYINVTVQSLGGAPVFRLQPQVSPGAAAALLNAPQVSPPGPWGAAVESLLNQMGLPLDSFHATIVTLMTAYGLPPSRDAVLAVKDLASRLPALLAAPATGAATQTTSAPATGALSGGQPGFVTQATAQALPSSWQALTVRGAAPAMPVPAPIAPAVAAPADGRAAFAPPVPVPTAGPAASLPGAPGATPTATPRSGAPIPPAILPVPALPGVPVPAPRLSISLVQVSRPATSAPTVALPSPTGLQVAAPVSVPPRVPGAPFFAATVPSALPAPAPIPGTPPPAAIVDQPVPAAWEPMFTATSLQPGVPPVSVPRSAFIQAVLNVMAAVTPPTLPPAGVPLPAGPVPSPISAPQAVVPPSFRPALPGPTLLPSPQPAVAGIPLPPLMAPAPQVQVATAPAPTTPTGAPTPVSTGSTPLVASAGAVPAMSFGYVVGRLFTTPAVASIPVAPPPVPGPIVVPAQGPVSPPNIVAGQLPAPAQPAALSTFPVWVTSNLAAAGPFMPLPATPAPVPASPAAPVPPVPSAVSGVIAPTVVAPLVQGRAPVPVAPTLAIVRDLAPFVAMPSVPPRLVLEAVARAAQSLADAAAQAPAIRAFAVFVATVAADPAWAALPAPAGSATPAPAKPTAPRAIGILPALEPQVSIPAGFIATASAQLADIAREWMDLPTQVRAPIQLLGVPPSSPPALAAETPLPASAASSLPLIAGIPPSQPVEPAVMTQVAALIGITVGVLHEVATGMPSPAMPSKGFTVPVTDSEPALASAPAPTLATAPAPEVAPVRVPAPAAGPQPAAQSAPPSAQPVAAVPLSSVAMASNGPIPSPKTPPLALPAPGAIPVPAALPAAPAAPPIPPAAWPIVDVVRVLRQLAGLSEAAPPIPPAPSLPGSSAPAPGMPAPTPRSVPALLLEPRQATAASAAAPLPVQLAAPVEPQVPIVPAGAFVPVASDPSPMGNAPHVPHAQAAGTGSLLANPAPLASQPLPAQRIAAGEVFVMRAAPVARPDAGRPPMPVVDSLPDTVQPFPDVPAGTPAPLPVPRIALQSPAPAVLPVAVPGLSAPLVMPVPVPAEEPVDFATFVAHMVRAMAPAGPMVEPEARMEAVPAAPPPAGRLATGEQAEPFTEPKMPVLPAARSVASLASPIVSPPAPASAATPAQAVFMPPSPAALPFAPGAVPAMSRVTLTPEIPSTLVETAVYMRAQELPATPESAAAAHEYLFREPRLPEVLNRLASAAAATEDPAVTLPAPVREAARQVLAAIARLKVSPEGEAHRLPQQLRSAVEGLGLEHEAHLALAASTPDPSPRGPSAPNDRPAPGEPRPTNSPAGERPAGRAPAGDTLKAAALAARRSANEALAQPQTAAARNQITALRDAASEAIQLVSSSQMGSASHGGPSTIVQVQLPFVLGGELRGGEVRVSWRKDKKKQRDPRTPANMTMEMETRSLGPIAVRMQVLGQSLSLVFRVFDNEVQGFLKGELPDLVNRLTGYRFSVDRAEVETAPPAGGAAAAPTVPVRPTATLDLTA